MNTRKTNTRDKRIIIRVTADEEKELTARAKAANCSKSDYIRSCTFNSSKGIKDKKYCKCCECFVPAKKFCGICGNSLI